MAKKKKTYKNHGTNDFLILTIVCGVIGVWAIFDGWFPSKKVLKKHPHELVLAFEQSGVVLSIDVKDGAPVNGGVVLANMATANIDAKIEAAEKTYEAAKKSGDSKLASKTLKELGELREVLLGLELKVAPRYVLEIDENGKPQVERAIFSESDPAYGKAYEPKGAQVKEILIDENRIVAAGEPAFVLQLKDSFYPFNKVLTVVMFIGFFIFGWFHVQAKKS